MFRTHYPTYKTAYTDACKTHYTTPAYNRLPEDEHSSSKHAEDIKKLKIRTFIYKRWILLDVV
jgi:hypothetical protein